LCSDMPVTDYEYNHTYDDSTWQDMLTAYGLTQDGKGNIE